jgi:heme/copper-type cytochrome/quinol oxidase subunit 2
MLPKSNRTFSRGVVVANCAAAWLAVAGSIWSGAGTAGIVVPTAMTLIAWLVAGYMGVGAVDFRTAVQAAQREDPKP